MVSGSGGQGGRKGGSLSKVWKVNLQSFELADDDKSMCRKRRTRMKGESAIVAKEKLERCAREEE